MNKKRKKELLDAVDILQEAADVVSNIQGDEQSSFDALPESFQYSQRGDAMQDAIDVMEGFIGDINTVADKISQYANS